MKPLVAILLSVLLLAFVPNVQADADRNADQRAFAERHPMAVEIWGQIEQTENELLQSGQSVSAVAQRVYTLVGASATTQPDSIVRHGDAFFWQTADGAVCAYMPGFRERVRLSVNGSDTTLPELKLDAETPELGEDPARISVFLPYQGLDASFTSQYADEGALLADAVSGEVRVYRTNEATVDAIANALAYSVTVILESHGATDWEDGSDCVSRANTSYVCLQTDAGLTDADFSFDTGAYGTYPHAVYGGPYRGRQYFCVDGTVIANHMTNNAQQNLLWMPVAFGMATEGLFAPLREKGVHTVYGYTQAIANRGDYAFAERFFGALGMGATVKSAISLMKRTCGLWDPTVRANSVAQAKTLKAAFPVVVSEADAYPGQGSADAPQVVRSGWKLKNPTFLYGDTNADGRVNAEDAALLLRDLVHISKIGGVGLLAADVDADGELTADDALLIVSRVIGRIDRFPAEA